MHLIAEIQGLSPQGVRPRGRIRLLHTSALGIGLTLGLFKPGAALAQEAPCGPVVNGAVTCSAGPYGHVGYNFLEEDTTVTLEPGVVVTDGVNVTSQNGVTGVNITVNAANTTIGRTTVEPSFLAAGIRVGTTIGLSGADLANAGDINIVAGHVDVSAAGGRGILGFGRNISIVADTVHARGATIPGVGAPFAVVADTVGTGGNIFIDVGVSSSAGNNAGTLIGYAANSAGSVSIRSGHAASSGNSSTAIIGVSGTGSVSITSGTAASSGNGSNAITVQTNGVASVTSDHASATGAGSLGIYAAGNGGVTIDSRFASVSGNTNPASGVRAFGIVGVANTNPALRDGHVIINSEEVEFGGSGAIGIFGGSLDGDVTINSGSVTGGGDLYYVDPAAGASGLVYAPVAIWSNSATGDITIASDSISVTNWGAGIGVTNTSGRVRIDSGSIETNGDGAFAIGTLNVHGDVTITSGTATTWGDAINLPNVAGITGGRSLFYADAIDAASLSGSVTVTSDDATVHGEGNQAITIIANTGATLNSRNATNMGQGVNAIGIVSNHGLIDVTLTGATTAANGSGISIVGLNETDITVDLSDQAAIQARDGGLLIVSGSGSTVVTNRGRIETTGTSLAYATGAALDVNASPGGSVVVNNHGTIVGGLANAGVLGAAITFSDGDIDETLNLFTGSHIVGSVDGQGGHDTLNLYGTVNAATPTQGFGDIFNFETLNVNTGYWVQGGQTAFEDININGGALILTGLATGDAVISEGAILQIGGGGTTGSLDGDITANGTLIFNRLDDYLFAGALAGRGALIKLGDGTVTIDGLYTFTGVTSILAGRLRITQLAADGALEVGENGEVDLSGGDQTVGGLNGSPGGTVNIDQGTLTINQTSGQTSVFGGALVGNGSLIVNGGALNLTGVNTYTGPTTVDNGTLLVNGSISSPVTINEGSILGGAGLVNGAILIRRNGVLSPGNSPGVLTIGGPLTLSAGSTLLIEIDPRTTPVNDRIEASGAVTIESGARLRISPQGPINLYQRVNDYTVIHAAGGLIGQFAPGDVTSDMPLLSPRLTYEPNRLRVRLARNDIPFRSIARSLNQVAVANAAEATGDAAPVYNALVLQTDDGLRAGLDALNGEIHGSVGSVLIGEGGNFSNRLLERMSRPGTHAFWAELDGAETSIDADSARGYGSADVSSIGLSVGALRQFEETSLGASLAYTDSELAVGSRLSNATAESLRGSLFGSRSIGPAMVRVGVAAGWSQIETNRNIAFPGVSQLATASYDVMESQLFAELSTSASLGAMRLEPFAGVTGLRQRFDRFAENATLGLGASRAEREVAFASFGVRVKGPDEWALKPRASLSWRHASGDVDGDITARFAGSPAFRVSGAVVDRDAMIVGVGLDYSIAGSLELSVGYNGVVAPDTRQHQAVARLAARF